MRDYRDAKAMAVSLRQALTARQVSVTHSDALELIAKSFGLDNWNILAAKIEAAAPDLAPADPAADAAEGGRSKLALYCSFCGKSQYEVAKLIAGPASFICDACVALCVAIVDETDVHSLMQKDRASGAAADYPALTASLKGRTREQLDKFTADTDRWIAHARWTLQEIVRELGEPVTTALQPPNPEARKVILAGKSRDQMIALKTDFERRLADSRTALEIAARVRAEAEAG